MFIMRSFSQTNKFSNSQNMRNKTKYTILFFIFFANLSFGQQHFWKAIPESQIVAEDAERQIIPLNYITYQADFQSIKQLLLNAPMRFSPEAAEQDLILTLPIADGSFEHFKIVEAPTMHADLQSKFPEIRSFAGKGIEDPTAYLRCGFSPKGFHAMILSGQHSTAYIDVYAKGTTEYYISYFKKDFVRQDGAVMSCGVPAPTKAASLKIDQPVPDITSYNSESPSDCQLRTYRLALACTGEYATFHGGTIDDVMAAFNVAMTRVNGVYETDATITMEMVPNNDQLIYLNAGSDPYSNGNGGTMLGQNVSTCNSVIGQANYDIGHVFSTGGGGVAGLGVVCSNNNKARGVTGLPSPIGDPFYVDYVSHEMGHQYGGNHTQNNSCNRVNAAAMEPGSASTIMGYAGICPPNVQNNSDDHFHAYSLSEIDNFVLNGNGGTCPVTTPLVNNAPTVTTDQPTYQIPISTPFALTGIGEDEDGDVLTYCWEQMNNEVASMPPSPTNTGGPAFRSISPHVSPTRYFPNIDAIINNQTPTWEVLPSVSRNMDFRCTVRDNSLGAGCQAITDVDVNTHANAGPFLVLSPNTADIMWQIGAIETVNWDVANTDQNPVNCQNVDIVLSLDGGYTYTVLLAEQVPNTGSHDILVPNNLTDQARVQIICSNNIFFDISDQDFSIVEPPAPTFFMDIDPQSQDVCQSEDASYSIELAAVLGFDEEIIFTATNVPANVTLAYSNNPTTPPGTVDIIFGNLSESTPGTYLISIDATSSSVNRTLEVELIITGDVIEFAENHSPADGEAGTIPNPQLSWDAVSQASFYFVEIADGPDFSNIIESASVNTTSYQPQNLTGANVVFYWRVSASNMCSEGTTSDGIAFQTGGSSCQTFSSPNLPLEIPDTDSGDFITTLDIDDDFLITDLNTSFDIQHTWVGDLRVTLESPDGSAAVIFDQPGFPASNFGCDGDNIEATFDDDAFATADDFENTCEGSAPTIQGDFQPLDAFSIFNGENAMGTWTLTVFDAFAEDGGSVNGWDLELCTSIATAEPILTNELFTVIVGASKAIDNTYLFVDDAEPVNVRYTLLSLPENGVLKLNGNTLAIGDHFSQKDIDDLLFEYEHDGSNTTSDSFLFDVLGSDDGWLHANEFLINIIQDDLGGLAVLDNDIDCNDANNAQITALPSGGTMPYEYSIDGINFQLDNVFPNLSGGTYSVIIRDANGFEITTNSLTVTNPPLLNIDDASVNNNDITVTASGGTGNLTYSINGIDFQDSNVFADLDNGIYTITVIDENGCTTEGSAIVAVDDLLVNVVLLNGISCHGETDANVQFTAAGGIPPYEYYLGNEDQMDPFFQEVGPGTYIVKVVDSEGNESFGNTLTIIEPDPLIGTESIVDYDLTITAQGGTPPYMYSIGGGDFQPENVFLVTQSGSYSVYIQDANGCMVELEFTLLIDELAGTSAIVQGISCQGEEDAIIELIVAGGVPPYQYSLDGVTFQDDNVFTNVPPGVYLPVIMDSGTSISVSPVSIVEPDLIFVSTNVNLGYNVTISAMGGTGDFMYSIDGGMTWQSSNMFTVFANGSYDVLVQDENGCAGIGSFEIDVEALGIEAVILDPISCNGENDGEILATSSGGIPPYSYSLNGSTFMPNGFFDNLEPGTYTVEMMDAGGNTLQAPPIILEEPDPLTATVDVVFNNATVTPTGGTPPYLYALNGGFLLPDSIYQNLANGSYEVEVFDANGCTTTVSFTTNVIINATILIENPLCTDDENGSILVSNVVGGTPPFIFQLNNNPAVNNPLFENLPAGNYSLLITDQAGNEYIIDDLTLTNPPALMLDTELDVNNLTINASGGTDPLQYSIDGGMTFGDENVFNDLPNGDYNVVVMDANGCTLEDVVNVNVSPVNDLKFDLLFEINPNPGNGFLVLKIHQQTNRELAVLVYDAAGRMVFEKEYLKNSPQFETSIDLTEFAEGTYQVLVSDGEIRGLKQLVILK